MPYVRRVLCWYRAASTRAAARTGASMVECPHESRQSGRDEVLDQYLTELSDRTRAIARSASDKSVTMDGP
jgi:hypothetical protein